jgi:hypothetical protein
VSQSAPKLDYASTGSRERPRRKYNYRFWNITFWVRSLLVIVLVNVHGPLKWLAVPFTVLSTIAWILVKAMRRARLDAKRPAR